MIKTQVKIEIVLLIITLLFTGNCKKESDDDEPKIMMSYGIKHIYNPAAPRDGVSTLEMRKILEIDSQKIDAENPAFFHQATHGPDGSIFLMDGKAVRIYKFTPTGRLITHFVNKGNGPAEFPYLGRIEMIDNKVWVSGARKLAAFDENGTFIDEKKFKRSYWPFEVIDGNRFLGNYSRNEDDKKVPKRTTALLDMEENILMTMLKSDITGMIRVEKNGLRLSFSNSIVTPNILAHYNRLNGLVYMAVTNEYKIILKDIKGKTRQLIFKAHQRKTLNQDDKSKIANGFHYLQAHEKKIIKEHLPGTFCAIKNIQLLHWGYLAVSRITGIKSVEIDIFDGNGVFVHLVKLPDGVPDSFMFYGDKLTVIKQEDNSSIYIQYQITNLPEIFGK